MRLPLGMRILPRENLVLLTFTLLLLASFIFAQANQTSNMARQLEEVCRTTRLVLLVGSILGIVGGIALIIIGQRISKLQTEKPIYKWVGLILCLLGFFGIISGVVGLLIYVLVPQMIEPRSSDPCSFNYTSGNEYLYIINSPKGIHYEPKS